MPREQELPGSLAKLARRHAIAISDVAFHTAVNRLIADLRPGAPDQPNPPTPESVSPASLRPAPSAQKTPPDLPRRPNEHRPVPPPPAHAENEKNPGATRDARTTSPVQPHEQRPGSDHEVRKPSASRALARLAVARNGCQRLRGQWRRVAIVSGIFATIAAIAVVNRWPARPGDGSSTRRIETKTNATATQPQAQGRTNATPVSSPTGQAAVPPYRTWTEAIKLGTNASATNLSLNADGSLLATTGIGVSAGTAGPISIWHVPSKKKLRVLLGHSAPVRSLTFSPSEPHVLASASEDHTVRVWDLDQPARKSLVWSSRGHRQSVRSVAFRTNAQLVSIGDDNTVRLWNGTNGTPQRSWHLDLQRWATTFALTRPGGNWLLSEIDRRTITIWNTELGTLHRTITLPEEIGVAALSPNAHRLAVAGKDGTVIVWDVQSASISHTLTGHKGRVRVLTFAGDHPDLLVTGSDDTTVNVWDLRQSADKALVQRLQEHNSKIVSVSIAPGSRTIAASSDNAVVWIWKTAAESPLLNNY